MKHGKLLQMWQAARIQGFPAASQVANWRMGTKGLWQVFDPVNSDALRHTSRVSFLCSADRQKEEERGSRPRPQVRRRPRRALRGDRLYGFSPVNGAQEETLLDVGGF